MQRLWYPEAVIDEWLPPGRPSPQAWLAPLNDPSADEEDQAYVLDAQPGDRVGFKWCEFHGLLSIVINPDGSLHGAQRCPLTLDLFGHVGIELPADVRLPPNHFFEEDSEIWADSAENFARHYADFCAPFEGDEPVTVEVDAAHWSDTIYFIISPDGEGLIPASPETSQNVQG